MRYRFLSIISVFFILGMLFLPSSCRRHSGETAPEQEETDSIPALGFWPDSLDCVEDAVKSGEVFSSFMTRLGMNPDSANALANMLDTILNVRNIKAGNKLKAYYEDGKLEYVIYENAPLKSTIFKTTSPLSAWTYVKPVEVQKEYSEVTIHTSLWNDMRAAGVSDKLIAELEDIYEWSVDFFSLQEGDSFRVLYQDRRCDGEMIAVDTVYYAEFIRDSTVLPAIRLARGESGNKYWKSNGESLRKAFLKAPLKFTRISSGFSYHRKHPVTGKVKPHTAVDYAAPTGTPVRSIGNGTVISAGWAGGGGNTVKIKHNNAYTTSYMHLSKYAKGIHAGTKVSQGEVIGYVGMTGTATGPHLDFRVYKNGTAINPLKLVSPAEEPLRKEYMPELDSAARLYKHWMDSLAAPQSEKKHFEMELNSGTDTTETEN